MDLIDDFILKFQSTFSGLVEKEPPVEFLDISNLINDSNYASENTPHVNFMTVRAPRHKTMSAEEVYKDLGESDMVKFSV